MGCDSSKSKEEANTTEKSISKLISGRKVMPRKLVGGEMSADIIDSFNYIVKGVNRIVTPQNMVPILCFNWDTFPIFVSHLHISDNSPTNIELPVIAASIAETGRIVCFSQYEMMVSPFFGQNENSRLFRNVISWTASRTDYLTPIVLVDIPNSILKHLRNTFQTLGFYVESSTFLNSFSIYRVVVITSDIQLNKEKEEILHQFVQNGGGVICLYNETCNAESIPINSFLIKYGLSFAYCSLNDANSGNIILQTGEARSLCYKNFIFQKDGFRQLMELKSVDVDIIDDVVTILRYYIVLCDVKYENEILQIYESCMQYLTNHQYRMPNKSLFPSIDHVILATLIQSILGKLSAPSLPKCPDIDIFPGITGEVEYRDVEVTLFLANECLISTGLWLPAGIVASLTCTDIFSGLYIQVGIHNESLITHPSPWKRWPSVVFTYPLSNDMKISTSFGGIIYLGISNLPPDHPQSIKIRFHRIAKYPHAIQSKPQTLEKTRNIPVPWAEISSKSIILTVPSDYFKEISDFDLLITIIDNIAKGIPSFIGYKPFRPYRVCFDIDIIDGYFVPAYPIVLLKSDADDILLHPNQPTIGMYHMAVALSIVSIREDRFDEITENAISSLVACHILQTAIPEFEPSCFGEIEQTLLFKELWQIKNEYGIDIFQKLLIQDHPHTIDETQKAPDDQWTTFIRDLSLIANQNFSHILEKARPVPLNLNEALKILELPKIDE